MPNVMYCLKGHYVGIVNPVRHARSWGHFQAMMAQAENEGPQRLPAFCAACGAENISACQHCQAPIESQYPGSAHGFCGGCGKPFPWTVQALEAAAELADLQDSLSAKDRELLKKSLPDLIRDTPQTAVATQRVKALLAKAGKPAFEGFRSILVSVAAEVVKKQLFPDS